MIDIYTIYIVYIDIYYYISFCPFIQFLRFSQQVYWVALPFPPPVDHILPEVSAMTLLFWVAVESMAHSSVELCKPLCHKVVIHYTLESR